MTTIAEYNDLNIPTWALPYLVNGDSEGLTDAERQQIDRWTESFEDFASQPDAAFLISTEDHEFFTWHPEFGKGATCVTGTVKICK